MSYVATKGKFHVALDGVGLILQGAPDRPAYAMAQAPIYGNRFASGDRDYTDFSFWWFWAQTDWSGGYKLEDQWKDDAQFFDSEGVSISVYPGDPGTVRLNAKQLNTVSSPSAKNRTWMSFGDPYGTFMILGRNNTDQKMCAVNAYNGSVVWEDTATGANEKILCSDKINDELYIGCRTVGSGASMLKKGTGGSFSDVGVHSYGIAIMALVAHKDTNSLFMFKWGDGLWKYDATAGTFTQKKTTLPMNITSASFFGFGTEGMGNFGAVLVGSRIYFTYKEANVHQVQLWYYDITTDAYVHVYTFRGGTFNSNVYLIERDGNLYLFGATGGLVYGRILIYKFDGTTMTQLHKIGRATDAQFSLVGGVVKNSESIYFGLDNNSSDYQIWQLDRSDKLFSGIKPPAAYATAINLIAMSGTGNLAVCKNGSGTVIDEFDSIPINNYQTSGYIVTSNFNADIPSIDKLFYAVTINFRKFVSSQSIEVQYSIDGGATFTSLGTASYTLDGGSVTSKTFFFGSTIVSKQMKLKFILSGSGNNTPELQAFAAQYVPVPVYTKQWVIQVNCADDLKRLDGALVETTGRELKSRLETAWWTKSLLDFEDVDYTTTTVSDNPLSASATTINVASTADFPEQGRLRCEDEEIFYTGKTPTSFTGCTRGVRGTVGASHAQNIAIHNAYKVLVTDINIKAPIMLQDKQLEYVVQLSLREG